MKSGIYQIVNKTNNKRYIGSSINVDNRLKQHKTALFKGKHKNSHLLYSFDKYGIDNFIFESVEHCDIDKLVEREQFWMDSYDFETLYNQRPLANSNIGRVMSEAEKQARTGFKHSEEAKKNMSGRTPANKKEYFNLICEHCGEEFLVPSWRLSKPVRFCSVKCKTDSTKGIKLEWMYKNKKQEGHSKANFRFVSPDLVLYEGLGINPFAREMNIMGGKLALVKSGKRNHHKGWRLPQEGDTYKKIISWQPKVETH